MKMALYVDRGTMNKKNCEQTKIDSSLENRYKDINFLIWGAGTNGKVIGSLLTDLEYKIIGYIDMNVEIQGTCINGIKVCSPNDLCSIEEINHDTMIVISASNDEAIKSIMTDIKVKLNYDHRDISCVEGSVIRNQMVSEYRQKYFEGIVYCWEIDFKSYCASWLENIKSEVEYWKNICISDGSEHEEYLRRISNDEFCVSDTMREFAHNYLKNGDVVVDLGCGLCSMYGSKLENGAINLISMDPLAHFYNSLNKRYSPVEFDDKKCVFGLLEFVDCFFSPSSIDCIIIDNALDHCVEPYRSLIKCLYVLKKGGIIRLVHRRSEALFEGWQGLHKWNVDYNKENEFILWNKRNAINVSAALEGRAEIKLYHTMDNKLPEDSYVTVEICKTVDKIDESENYSEDKSVLAYMLDKLMRMYAEKYLALD